MAEALEPTDEAEEGRVKQLLTDVVGSGPRSADDMSYRQAYAAFDEILDGDVDPATLGGFFVANRWKRNTPEELAGFLDAMRRRVDTAAPETSPVDCGANYDGKTDTALLGVASGLTAAAAGTPVVVHSADRVPASGGVTYRHVLRELDLAVDLTPEQSAAAVDDVGFGYYDATRFNPDVHGLLDRRRATGLRTFVNTVETLANPAEAPTHLGSFFHQAFAEKVCRTLERSGQSVERVVMFRGLEGYDDVRPSTAPVVVWEDGELRDFEVDPGEFGLSFERRDLELERPRAGSAKVTEEVLRGERTDGFHDAVVLNAALRVYASGDAGSLGVAVDVARGVLRDGDVGEKLFELREAVGTPEPV